MTISGVAPASLVRILVAVAGITLGGVSIAETQAKPDPATIELLIANGKPRAALSMTREWMETYPFDPDVRFSHARALSASGETEAAATLYRSLLVEFPQRLEIYNNLAANHAAAGNLDEAAALLEAGLERDGVAGVLWQNLREIYRILAIQAYRGAVVETDEENSLAPVDQESLNLERFSLNGEPLMSTEAATPEIESTPGISVE